MERQQEVPRSEPLAEGQQEEGEDDDSYHLPELAEEDDGPAAKNNGLGVTRRHRKQVRFRDLLTGSGLQLERD